MANFHLLSFSGEIDIFHKKWFENELSQVDRFCHPMIVVLDVTNVRYLDTTFLTAIIALHKRLKLHDARDRICVVAPTGHAVSRILQLTGLDDIFAVLDSPAAALRYAAMSRTGDLAARDRQGRVSLRTRAALCRRRQRHALPP